VCYTFPEVNKSSCSILNPARTDEALRIAEPRGSGAGKDLRRSGEARVPGSWEEAA